MDTSQTAASSTVPSVSLQDNILTMDAKIPNGTNTPQDNITKVLIIGAGMSTPPPELLFPSQEYPLRQFGRMYRPQSGSRTPKGARYTSQ